MSELVPEVPAPRVMPEGRRFQAGQSGNPRGRPKGLARKVREITGDNDGETLALFFSAAMQGKLPNPDYDTKKTPEEQPGVPANVTVGVKERIEAAKYLADRGWGKPPQFAPLEDDDPLDFAEKEAEQIAAEFEARMDELAERRRARDAAEQQAQA